MQEENHINSDKSYYNKMHSERLKDFGLYFITDRKLTKKSPVDDADSAARAGVKIIQYREKWLSAGQMIKEAKKIKKICKKNNALFLVNDRVDIALAVGADGVHLGQEDMSYQHARKLLGKNKIIGLSAHSAKGALHGQKIGADYIGIGPIYPTATKKDAKAPTGVALIIQLKNKLKIPFVAIGGINESNIDEVLKAGAKNIAIISGIVANDNVEKAVRNFIKKIDSTNSKF